MGRLNTAGAVTAARGFFFAAFAVLGACQTAPPERELLDALTAVQGRLSHVQAELTATRQALAERASSDDDSQQSLTTRIAELETQVGALPERIGSLCPAGAPVTTVATACPEIQRVVVSGDKMVVGELERVWIEPPGALIRSRIDTGADSSSVHATNIMEFERDGSAWARFDLKLEDETVTLERKIVRYVRVIQQADKEGARRPVVNLRVVLGTARENVEFTLADRSHLNFEMLLGRNFLTDVALVDVGKQYVQPAFKPEKP